MDPLPEVARQNPTGVPANLPDPYAGPSRNTLWRLYYSARGGARMQRHIDDLPQGHPARRRVEEEQRRRRA